jgi:hypothetical protein
MKKKNLIKDALSVGVVHPIKMLRDNKCIATGTGFFYCLNENLFFVTAGHNVTGRCPETNEIMGIPEKIVIMLYVVEDNNLLGWKEHEITLTDHDGVPVWLEHPEHKTEIDVVAIKVDLIETNALKPINKLNFDEKLPISVGMDVFMSHPVGWENTLAFRRTL